MTVSDRAVDVSIGSRHHDACLLYRLCGLMTDTYSVYSHCTGLGR